MTAENNTAQRKCLACGVALQTEFTFCPACGEPISPPGGGYPFSADQELSEFIEAANQHLAECGTGAAESAFGLSCYIGFIPIALLVIIVFLLGERNWIVLAIIVLVAVMVSTGMAALLSRRARSTNIASAYHRGVEPEIESYLEVHYLARSEFDSAARQTLLIDAPLLDFVSMEENLDDGVDME